MSDTQSVEQLPGSGVEALINKLRQEGIERGEAQAVAILDDAKPGDRILMVSFGSGAGSDAFDITVTPELLVRRNRALKTQDYIARRTEIDYAVYARMRGKIAMK